MPGSEDGDEGPVEPRPAARPAAAAGAAPPASLESFSAEAADVAENPLKFAGRLQRDGLIHVRGILDEELCEGLEAQVSEVLARRRADGDKRWFGDVYGYEDKGKRWDVKLEMTPEVRAALTAVLSCLAAFLEGVQSSWGLAELAAMCTFPGDPGQPVHADTSNIYDPQLITIFCALHDIALERGPTRFYPGTHTDGEVHIGLKQRDESSAVLGAMRRGDCVIMDSRLLHCGTANASDLHRFLFYMSWMPPVGRRSRGSTHTILEEYEDRFWLRRWRQWVAEEAPAAAPAAAAASPAAAP